MRDRLRVRVNAEVAVTGQTDTYDLPLKTIEAKERKVEIAAQVEGAGAQRSASARSEKAQQRDIRRELRGDGDKKRTARSVARTVFYERQRKVKTGEAAPLSEKSNGNTNGGSTVAATDGVLANKAERKGAGLVAKMNRTGARLAPRPN